MSPSDRLVLPGEEVAVVEEYEAGEGTYEEEGRLYASLPGRLELDSEHRIARVVPVNPPAILREGDVIYGTISDIRPSMVEARVLAIHGRDRQVAGEIDASLHISKIANAYVEDPRDAVRLGDIVRARVIQTDPSLQVTTAERLLGVVLALCANCRRPMERRGDVVHCLRCDRTDHRKLAADYGDPELTLPIASEPEPEGPRRERVGPEREERGRGRGPPRGRGGGRPERGGRGGRGRDRREWRR